MSYDFRKKGRTIDAYVLNPKVAKVLNKSAELAAAFFALHEGYDSDTDPLHNPDYVRRFSNDEERILASAEKAVLVARAFKSTLAGSN